MSGALPNQGDSPVSDRPRDGDSAAPPDGDPRPVLMRPHDGETKEQFVERLIEAMRAAGIPIRSAERQPDEGDRSAQALSITPVAESKSKEAGSES